MKFITAVKKFRLFLKVRYKNNSKLILFDFKNLIVDVSKTMHLLRSQIIIVAISVFLLSYEQSVDEYRALVFNAKIDGIFYWKSIFTLVSTSFTLFILYPFIIWFTSRWLTNRDETGKILQKASCEKQSFRKQNDTINWTRRWFPRLLAVAPLLAVGIAAWSNNNIKDTSFITPTVLFLVVLSPIALYVLIINTGTKLTEAESVCCLLLSAAPLFAVIYASFFGKWEIENRLVGAAIVSSWVAAPIWVYLIWRARAQNASQFQLLLARLFFLIPPVTLSVSGYTNLTLNNGGLLYTVYLSSLIFSVLWIYFLWHRTINTKFRNISNKLRIKTAYTSLLFLSFTLILFIFTLKYDTELPQTLGILTYGVGFFIFIIIISTFLVWGHLRTGVPYMILIGLWAAGLAYFNLTDNHKIQLLATEPVKGKRFEPPTGFEAAFTSWLNKKIAGDIIRGNNKQGDEIPVYVVAAAGGGIFAAQNAAFVLAKLDDSLAKLNWNLTENKKPDNFGCGEFSRNVFAISSISGGSVGAALHGAMLKDQAEASHLTDCAKPEALMFPRLSEILNKDLLAPVVANLAMLDYPQRFVPVLRFGKKSRFLEFPDRALALENAILAAVRDVHNRAKPQLNLAASDLWNAESERPALILNTAELDSGRTVASSPFSLRIPQNEISELSKLYPRENATFREILAARPEKMDIYLPPDNCADELKKFQETELFDKKRDLSLIQAAVLSARFPYASPAGTITKLVAAKCGIAKGDTEVKEQLFAVRSQYIDGGYVEASGTEQALKVVNLMQQVLDKKCVESNSAGRMCDVKIHMIAITLKRDDILSDNSYGMILTPPIGLLKTWSRRSKTSVEAADAFFDRKNKIKYIGEFHEIKPHDRLKEIPLGWRLSLPTSRKLEELICETRRTAGEPSSLDVISRLRKDALAKSFMKLPKWECISSENSASS